MKHFINHRIQGQKVMDIKGMYQHTLRIIKSRNQQNNNVNYCYDFKEKKTIKVVYISRKDQKNLSEEDLKQYKKDRKILLNYYHRVIDDFENDRDEHNEIFKKKRRGENLPETTGTHGEGVFTFSEQMQYDYKNGKIDLNELMKCGIKGAEETLKYLNGKDEDVKVENPLINCAIHVDEKTIHLHYHFKNYDKNASSLTHNANMVKKGLSKSHLQDIAFNAFNPKYGVARGIEKEISGRTRHMETIEYYEDKIKELNEKIVEQKSTIQTQIDDMTKVVLEKSTIINELDEKVKETIDLRKTISKLDDYTSKQKKEFYSKISAMQNKLRTTRKAITSKNEEKKKLWTKFTNVITNSEEQETRNQMPKNLVNEALEFYDLLNNKVDELSIEEVSKDFDNLLDEIKSLKMVIVGQNEEIAKKDEKISLLNTKIGNMDYKVNNVNSMIEIAKDEATKPIKDDLNKANTTIAKQQQDNLRLQEKRRRTSKLIQNSKKRNLEKSSSSTEKINDLEIENDLLKDFLDRKDLLKEYKEESNKLFDDIWDNPQSINIEDNTKKKKYK